MRLFYTSNNKNYRQHNSFRRSFSRNNQNFKNKNYNKKMNPLNNEGDKDATFVGRNFIWEKTVLMQQKTIIMIYNYMNN